MKKFSVISSVLIVCLFILSGCAAKSGVRSDEYYQESQALLNNMPNEEGNKAAGTDGIEIAAGVQGQKLITTVQMSIETMDYETSVSKIREITQTLGGYIENSKINGTSYNRGTAARQASFVLRIPSDKLGDFESTTGDIGNILSHSENVKDVTLEYSDTASRIKALQAQRDSLLAMLAKSENLSDMLTVQDHLTQVEYQLEKYESSLRSYDNKIEYSTVNINLYEVKQLTEQEEDPDTFGEKLLSNLKSSLKGVAGFAKNFVLFFIGYLPTILLCGGFAFLLFLLIRKIVRRSRAKEAAGAQQEYPSGRPQP